MRVIYIIKHDGKLLISDREIFIDSVHLQDGSYEKRPTFVGHAKFLLEATGRTLNDDICGLMGNMKDGECQKMILMKFPAEGKSNV